MQQFPALAVMVRHGLVVAAGASLVVLALFLWLAMAPANGAFWIVLGVVAAVACGFLLLLVRDIVRIIADTLIPAP